MWPEAAKTATHLNNLMPVTIDDVTKTHWEWAGYDIPEEWTKNLCTFGKAGVVKEGKQGKVLDRGITMMFVGYSENHAEMVFRMYHPETSRIVQTRDVIWMGRMYHTRQNAGLTQQLPIVTVPISIHDKSDDAEIRCVEIATIPLSEERGVLNDSSSMEAHEWVPVKTRYGHTVGKKDGAYNPSSGTTIKWSDLVAAKVDNDDIMDILSSNYYEVLGIDENEAKVLKEFNDSVSEYLNVGAGIGGRFVNTNELRVMSYHEAINGPDGEQ